jgi:quercetin dioxygenase-like cupin family protein
MISFLAIALSLAGQAAVSEVGPMSQDPYHRLALKNKMVQVYDVVLPPKAVMRFHAHPTNHLAVLIRPGTLQNELLGGPAKLNPTGPAGTVVYVGPGPPHRQTNIGADIVHFVAVELASGKAPHGEQPKTGFAHEEQTVTFRGTGCNVVVEKPDARAWRCRLAPGQSIFQTRSASFLRIPITAGVLRTGSERKASRMTPGRPSWRKSAARLRLTNVGKAPAEFVDIEIK